MLLSSVLPPTLKLKEQSSQSKSFTPHSQQSLTASEHQNMSVLLSSANSTGILQVANMKVNSESWKNVFKRLRQQMLSNSQVSSSQSPHMISYLKSLCLINNRKPTIIKEIEFLSFPVLTKLSLDGNKIESIEAIQFMHLPCLKQLYLYRNFIRSFQPLERCQFPELHFVSIYDNFGFEMQKWNRMEHQISRLWLQGEYFRVQSQDISCIVKLANQELNMTELGIKSEKRILQEKVFDAIRNRHKSIKILYDMYRTYDENEEAQQQQQ